MTNIDKLYGPPPKKGNNSLDSPLDQVFHEQEENQYRQIRAAEAEKIRIEREIAVKKAKKELRDLEASADSSSSISQSNTALELVKILVKQGMEWQKATEMVANMDQETLLKLAVLGGGPGGAQNMMPLLMLSRQPNMSPEGLVGAAKSIIDMSRSLQPPSSQTPVTDLANAVSILSPKRDDEALSYLNDKLEKMDEKLDAEREARHQAEIRHQEEMRRMQQENTDRQLAELSKKIEEAKTKQPEDPFDYIATAKKKLTDIGLVGEPAATRTPLEEANEIMGTIVNSPGVTRVFGAVEERIRNRPTAGGVPGARPSPPRQPLSGQTAFCDSCLAKGERTVLTLTPEVIAGTATIVCPKCGTEFRNGNVPPPPPPPSSLGGNPGGGQPPGGGPPGPPRYFPGQF